jgi:hypothetical protein
MTADAVPSNHVPWIIIGVCYVACIILLFSIRVLLARENKRRDGEPRNDTFNDLYIVTSDKVGNRTEVKVSKVRVRSLSESLYLARSSSYGSANRSFWI